MSFHVKPALPSGPLLWPSPNGASERVKRSSSIRGPHMPGQPSGQMSWNHRIPIPQTTSSTHTGSWEGP